MIGDAVAAGLCVLVVLTATITSIIIFSISWISNNWESVSLFLPGMLYYVMVIWIQWKCLYSILQYSSIRTSTTTSNILYDLNISNYGAKSTVSRPVLICSEPGNALSLTFKNLACFFRTSRC